MTTLTGLLTLHDTVGIIYQNINLDSLEGDEGLPQTFTNRCRRRTFQAIDIELPFYAKKAKITSGFQPDIQGNTEANEDNNVIANMNLYKRTDAVFDVESCSKFAKYPFVGRV